MLNRTVLLGSASLLAAQDNINKPVDLPSNQRPTASDAKAGSVGDKIKGSAGGSGDLTVHSIDPISVSGLRRKASRLRSSYGDRGGGKEGGGRTKLRHSADL